MVHLAQAQRLRQTGGEKGGPGSTRHRRAVVARKFLYVIAGLVVLVIAALLVYRIWGMQLIRAVMIPREAFAQLPPLPADAYDKQAMWIARPDIDFVHRSREFGSAEIHHNTLQISNFKQKY